MINIQPITITSFPNEVLADKVVINSFTITKENIEFPASCNLEVGIADINGNFQSLGNYVSAMTAEQYAEWGTDDEYAIDCFLTNLNITRE